MRKSKGEYRKKVPTIRGQINLYTSPPCPPARTNLHASHHLQLLLTCSHYINLWLVEPPLSHISGYSNRPSGQQPLRSQISPASSKISHSCTSLPLLSARSGQLGSNVGVVSCCGGIGEMLGKWHCCNVNAAPRDVWQLPHTSFSGLLHAF